jgi:multiple sugar transport system substrate-binding protein
MNNRLSRFLALLILVALVGCNSLPFSIGNGRPPATLTAPVTKIPSATNLPGDGVASTPSLPEEATIATQPAGGQLVRIWLAPEFDPGLENEASVLFKARLQEFQVENPSMELEVRVKALEGPGGMLDALVATSAAAPSDLPDLVLLPRTILESAALKGLLFPFDNLTTIMDDQSWFGYALQLAHLKTSTYGIPWAGNAMVMAYHTSISTAPISSTDLLTQGKTLLYPAADPQALFTLGMYLADNGVLQDDQGRPTLELTPLLSVLNYFGQASLSDVMPYTLTQFSDDDQVWEAFIGGQYPLAITWASTYLKSLGTDRNDLMIGPLPTLDGVPFTLTTGWSWALAGQDPERRSLAIKLAEYLVAQDFLSKWTQAAGYLPPTVEALQGWQASDMRAAIEQISNSAALIPAADILSTIGPALKKAVVDVLEAREDPQSAAQSAIKQVNQP